MTATVKELAAHFKLCEESIRRKARELGGFKLPNSNVWRFPEPATLVSGLALPGKEAACSRETAVDIG